MRNAALLAFSGLMLCVPAAYAAENATQKASVSPIDPVRVEKARAVVELAVPSSERQSMFARIVDAYMNNALAGIMDANSSAREALSKSVELRKIFSNFIDRQRTLILKDLEETTPELMLAYTNAYARNFTADELDGLKLFLITPLGQKYISKTAELSADPDFGTWQRGISARAEARKDTELKKFMEEIMPVLRAMGAENHGS